MTEPNNDLLDRAGQVRDGDALDSDAVLAYLQEHVDGLSASNGLEVRQFPGGASNLTYELTVGTRKMILRRPPSGTKPKSGHDMGREYRVLNALNGDTPHFAYAPKPLAYCEDEGVIGAPFYVMDKRAGIIVRRDLPKGMALDPDAASALCASMVDVLAELHALDPAQVGLADFGKAQGYVARQISGWNTRYQAAHTPDVPENPAIMAWLDDKQPADSGDGAIIHNDYKLDNVVLDPDQPARITGVLDWEMATLGDPLMDLGCSLAYWVQSDDPPYVQMARMLPSHLPGMWTRQQLVDHYAERSGRAVGHIDFYFAFGLFRLAVIAQQIYYRYYHGQTTNPKFKLFGQFVPLLIDRAQEIADQSGL